MMRKYSYLLLCFLFLLEGCGKIEKETTEEAQRFDTEEAILFEETAEASETETASSEAVSLSGMLENITNSIDDSDSEIWYRHYKNRTIVYENGFTYRIFSDGIYCRAEGSKDWEPLYQGKMTGGRTLESFKEFLYFTLNREGEDPEGVFVRQTLWQLNLNTLECKKIGDMIEDLPYMFSVYNENLYIGYSRIGALRYNAYPLNEQGIPGEK